MDKSRERATKPEEEWTPIDYWNDLGGDLATETYIFRGQKVAEYATQLEVALQDARDAINSLDDKALGLAEYKPGNDKYIKDELLAKIDKTLKAGEN